MEVLTVKVKPSSKHQKIEQQDDGSWIVHLKSPPIDGKANAELIKVLSDRFDVPKSCITIRAGATSKLKRIEIDCE